MTSIGALKPANPPSLSLIKAEFSGQASTLAYLQNFRPMVWMTLAALALLIVLRTLRQAETAADTPTTLD